MALFFDQDWFDAQLGRLHMRREDMGVMLGLDATGTAELWKDQRELSADDVAILAALFNVPAAEVASHAGISTPVPSQGGVDDRAILARLDAIESKLDAILAALDTAAVRPGSK